MTEEERKAEEKRRKEKFLSVIAWLYADGYAEGSSRVASSYGFEPKVVAAAADSMEDRLRLRITQITESLTVYTDKLEAKAAELRAAGEEGAALEIKLSSFADDLANKKSQQIAEIEHGTGRIHGAAETMNESGLDFEWRFPHFDLGRDHDECPVCEAIREGAPYTAEEAEAEGFPDLPHPHCDHGWVIVPKGQETQTEQFPQLPDVPRFVGGRRS
jgi:hypothetical protein